MAIEPLIQFFFPWIARAGMLAVSHSRAFMAFHMKRMLLGILGSAGDRYVSCGTFASGRGLCPKTLGCPNKG
jgi:hypothetical protein